MEGAVECLDALAQPGDAAAGRVGATRAGVGDLDEQVAAALVEVDLDARARGMLGRVGERLGDDEVRRCLDRGTRPELKRAVHEDIGAERCASDRTAASRPRSASTGGAIPRASSRSSRIAAAASSRASRSSAAVSGWSR
jgi:hypothetical protein